VRRGNFYDVDDNLKNIIAGRVLPSEWPDGGHNSGVGDFTVPDENNFLIDPTDPSYISPKTREGNAPLRISNDGRFYSAADLAKIYDPVMWQPIYDDLEKIPGSGLRDTKLLNTEETSSARMPSSRHVWPDVSSSSSASAYHGGGNTFRIGRPEHPGFDRPGKHAAHLLDLFHAGRLENNLRKSTESPTVQIQGHVNINTAEKDVIRAMAAGMLNQDDELCSIKNWNHSLSSGKLSPMTSPLKLGSPTRDKTADLIAEGVIRLRPFASFKEMASIRDENDEPIFGNKKMYPLADKIQWSDSAAEEIFARVYDASTLRSRNFRVWIVGQAITKAGDSVKVLAESKKVFTVFADPGEREKDGRINLEKSKVRITFENCF
jgi:hypothetical protein